MRLYGDEKPVAETRMFVRDYKRRIEANPRSRYVAVRDLVSDKCRVLDYGCGAFSKMLAERGNEAVTFSRVLLIVSCQMR